MGTPAEALSTQTVDVNKLYQRYAQELEKGLAEQKEKMQQKELQEGKLVTWETVKDQSQVSKPDTNQILARPTTVSTRPESVSMKSFLKGTIGAVKSQYKKLLKMSKSHNLLIARFAAGCGVGVLGSLLSTSVSVEEIKALQTEARKEALTEIAHNLTQTERDRFLIEVLG